MTYQPLTENEVADFADFIINLGVAMAEVSLFLKIADLVARVDKRPVFEVVHEIKLVLGQAHYETIVSV